MNKLETKYDRPQMSPGKTRGPLKDGLHWDVKTLESAQGTSDHEKIYIFCPVYCKILIPNLLFKALSSNKRKYKADKYTEFSQ